MSLHDTLPALRPASMPTVELPEKFGRYRIIRKIAEGGMGAVFLAEDESLDRKVALKVPQFAEDVNPMILQRFMNEARIAAKVEHPNLCSIYDVGEIENVHYLTMPYVQGPTLATLISPEHPWPASKALRLVHQLALALQSLHSQGIIHRDLKPGNVMLQHNTKPIIMDFGIARKLQSETQQLTKEGTTLGTPAYMPPEQLVGEVDEIGPHTDVYALGVILYQLLTGHLPHEGDDFNSMCAKILHREAKPPSALVPNVSPEVDALCLKALAKNRRDRFASMSEFAQAMQKLLPEKPNPNSDLIPEAVRTAATLGAYEATEPQFPAPAKPDDSSIPGTVREDESEQQAPSGPLTVCLNVLMPLLPWIVTVGFVVYWTVHNR